MSQRKAPPPPAAAPSRLTRGFFARPTLEVARDLLGTHLVRRIGRSCLTARVVEVEAYVGTDDTACHAAKGRTKRTEPMFGQPGFAYVYFTYGMHWLLNAVTEIEGVPAAVLIRAAEPLSGIDRICALRPGRSLHELASGPAKLTKALAIDGDLNRTDLVYGRDLSLRRGDVVAEACVERTPRIGIAYAEPKDRAALWRFSVAGSPHVSRPR